MKERADGLELHRLDLNLLLTFTALVEEKSVTRAGERLFLSQSATSGALSRLREFFGDDLLVRSGRGLEPTARAIELMEAIRPHLAGLTQAVAAAVPFDPASDRRVFRLGCTDAFAFAALPALSAQLRSEAPACDLVVRIGDYRTLPGLLAANEVSLIGGYLRDDPAANAKVRLLREAPWVLLRDASSPPIDGDLDRFCARIHALVTPLGDLHGFSLDDLLARLGKERRIAIGVTSFAMLLALLPGTELVASVPDFVARPLARLGHLAVEELPIQVPPVPNSLAWRAAVDRDAAEQWFRQAVREAFSEASGQLAGESNHCV
jgi:LysR family transcriptional activator of mexEF-oprN operon